MPPRGSSELDEEMFVIFLRIFAYVSLGPKHPVTLRDFLNCKIRRSTIWSWMMLPFGIVVIVTRAYTYLGATALIITTALCGCALLPLQRSLSALRDLLVVALSHFRYAPLDTGMVHLLSELRSVVRHRA